MPPYIDTVAPLFNSYMIKISAKPQPKSTKPKPQPQKLQTSDFNTSALNAHLSKLENSASKALIDYRSPSKTNGSLITNSSRNKMS